MKQSLKEQSECILPLNLRWQVSSNRRLKPDSVLTVVMMMHAMMNYAPPFQNLYWEGLRTTKPDKGIFWCPGFQPIRLDTSTPDPEQCVNTNEWEKKRQYNQRIVEVENGSFTPVVFSAFGGCGRETQHFLSFLAEKLARKKKLETPIASRDFLRSAAITSCMCA